MKLTLKNEKKVAIIEVPQATAEQVARALHHAFDFVGGQTTAPSVTRPSTTVAVETAAPRNVITEQGKKAVVDKLVKAVSAEVQNRSKALPKVNDDRTLFTNLGEQFGDKLQALTITSPQEPVPDFWETGIKNIEIDGEEVPTYRTYYYCPEGHKGKRYIKKDKDHVHCHDCNTKIGVRFAHEDGFPHRDRFGNFYIADLPYDDDGPHTAVDSE